MAEADFYVKDSEVELMTPHLPQPAAHKSERLLERLAALTTPKERMNLEESLVANLPTEGKRTLSLPRAECFVLVLLVVFSYLDDLSLHTAASVCSRWRQIVHSVTNPSVWKRCLQICA